MNGCLSSNSKYGLDVRIDEVRGLVDVEWQFWASQPVSLPSCITLSHYSRSCHIASVADLFTVRRSHNKIVIPLKKL